MDLFIFSCLFSQYKIIFSRELFLSNFDLFTCLCTHNLNEKTKGQVFLGPLLGKQSIQAKEVYCFFTCVCDVLRYADRSLRSWRYCVGSRLKFWWRSRVPKKRNRDEAVDAASPLVKAPPSNLTRLLHNTASYAGYADRISESRA